MKLTASQLRRLIKEEVAMAMDTPSSPLQAHDVLAQVLMQDGYNVAWEQLKGLVPGDSLMLSQLVVKSDTEVEIDGKTYSYYEEEDPRTGKMYKHWILDK